MSKGKKDVKGEGSEVVGIRTEWFVLDVCVCLHAQCSTAACVTCVIEISEHE